MRRRQDRDRRPHRRAGRSRAAGRPRSAFCVRRPHPPRRRGNATVAGDASATATPRDRQRRGRGFLASRRTGERSHIGSHRFRLADHRRPPAVRSGRAPTRWAATLGSGETRVRLAAAIVSAGGSPAVGESDASLGGAGAGGASEGGSAAAGATAAPAPAREAALPSPRWGRAPMRSGRRRRRGCRFEGSGSDGTGAGATATARAATERGRKKAQGIDVPVRIARQADAEVQVRLGPLGVTRPAERPDRIALIDRRAPSDPQRAEVDERDGVAVGGTDRDRASTPGDRSREGDDCRRAARARARPPCRRRRSLGAGRPRTGRRRPRTGATPVPTRANSRRPRAGASTRNARSKRPVVRSRGNTASRVGGRDRRCQCWLQTSHTFV